MPFKYSIYVTHVQAYTRMLVHTFRGVKPVSDSFVNLEKLGESSIFMKLFGENLASVVVSVKFFSILLKFVHRDSAHVAAHMNTIIIYIK